MTTSGVDPHRTKSARPRQHRLVTRHYSVRWQVHSCASARHHAVVANSPKLLGSSSGVRSGVNVAYSRSKGL